MIPVFRNAVVGRSHDHSAVIVRFRLPGAVRTVLLLLMLLMLLLLLLMLLLLLLMLLLLLLMLLLLNNQHKFSKESFKRISGFMRIQSRIIPNNLK